MIGVGWREIFELTCVGAAGCLHSEHQSEHQDRNSSETRHRGRQEPPLKGQCTVKCHDVHVNVIADIAILFTLVLLTPRGRPTG